MLKFIKEHYQFLFMLLIWVIAGAINQFIAFAIIPLSIIILKQKDRYIELLMGFIFILIISDSRNPMFSFAVTAKTIYLILLSLLFFLKSKPFNAPNKFIIPWIPFFIIAIFSLYNSPIPKIAAQKTISYLLLYITIPAYVNKCLHDYREEFLRYLIYFLSFILVLGLLLVLVTPAYSLMHNRFMGIFGNPNGVGLFCIIFFAMITVIFTQYPNLVSKFEKKWIFGIVIFSVLLSISRNSIFSILILLFFQRFYNISNWIGFIIVIIIAILYQVIAMNIISIISSMGLEDYFRLETLKTGSGRLVAWTYAWGYIQDHFVFGKGFAFDENLFHINQDALQRLGHQGGVHNFYLAIWLNTGVIGLIAYMYGYFKTFTKAAFNSSLAFPIMFCFLFSLTFETWLMGSLNPYNICFVITMVILLYKPSNEPKAAYPVS